MYKFLPFIVTLLVIVNRTIIESTNKQNKNRESSLQQEVLIYKFLPFIVTLSYCQPYYHRESTTKTIFIRRPRQHVKCNKTYSYLFPLKKPENVSEHELISSYRLLSHLVIVNRTIIEREHYKNH